jgi:hypothetical protein
MPSNPIGHGQQHPKAGYTAQLRDAGGWRPAGMKKGVEGPVRTFRRVRRKTHSAEEKVRTVLEGLRAETKIAAPVSVGRPPVQSQRPVEQGKSRAGVQGRPPPPAVPRNRQATSPPRPSISGEPMRAIRDGNWSSAEHRKCCAASTHTHCGWPRDRRDRGMASSQRAPIHPTLADTLKSRAAPATATSFPRTRDSKAAA